MTNPASLIIQKFGGVKAVAEIFGVHETTVLRWTYPRDRCGSDGVIPAKHQVRLLKAAKDRGIALSPADFFDRTEDEARVA